MCASAGEALPREVGESFCRHFGCDILDGLGSTEMLHIFMSNRAGDVHYGSSGLPVPGYEIELRDADGRPVASGEIGELYVRGPSAALLYWANREKSPPPSKASGSGPATSTAEMPPATSPMPAAATTC